MARVECLAACAIHIEIDERDLRGKLEVRDLVEHGRADVARTDDDNFSPIDGHNNDLLKMQKIQDAAICAWTLWMHDELCGSQPFHDRLHFFSAEWFRRISCAIIVTPQGIIVNGFFTEFDYIQQFFYRCFIV